VAAVQPTTGVAPGVMPPQVLGGPVWWYFVGVYVLAAALAVYCLSDSLRPTRASRLADLREPNWLYTVLFAVYLVCVFGVWIPAIPRAVSAVPVVLTPLALALAVAYLLRVVFPKASVEAAVSGTDADAGNDEPEPVSPEDTDAS